MACQSVYAVVSAEQYIIRFEPNFVDYYRCLHVRMHACMLAIMDRISVGNRVFRPTIRIHIIQATSIDCARVGKFFFILCPPFSVCSSHPFCFDLVYAEITSISTPHLHSLTSLNTCSTYEFQCLCNL